jgi:tetratricopeptide repeat protein
MTELASVLERRIGGITDADERLAMEVKRGKVLLEAGDPEGARAAFEGALAERPEDPGALSALADLCVSERDWEAAEQALVRLARLLPTPDEQRSVYARLGDLYSAHLVNLSRAEVALKEVLKRAPEDVETTEKLVDVYKRQNDSARAAELQQELVAKAQSPEEKRRRVLELAAIHEHVAHDDRRAEQTLEAARREFPQDVAVLRALAEFYTNHHQAPAVNILLDRAGGDARRALVAGRVSPAIFEVLGTVSDLRGKKDAARVARAMLAVLAGQPAEIGGTGHRAFDPRLDDLLAPEGLTAPLRALLAKTGDALDQASPVDLRAMKAVPATAETSIARLAAGVAQAIGLGPVQVLVSPKLGAVCIPVGSSPPVIVVGEALPGSERFAGFLVLRALKLVQARASALVRSSPGEVAVLLSAWLKCFNPKWQPPGVNPALLNAVGGRLQAVLPRNADPDVATIALEAATAVGAQAASLGGYAGGWADRVALLALGDCNAAMDAIAAASGAAAGAPREPKERAVWIARTAAARDLLAFAVTDAFAQVRAQLGAD